MRDVPERREPRRSASVHPGKSRYDSRSQLRRDTERRKRVFLMRIITLAWAATVAAWTLMGTRGVLSQVMAIGFGAGTVAGPTVLLVLYKRWLPQRVIEIGCLVLLASVSAVCMALRLYFPAYRTQIDIGPLYVWVPVMYVLAFTLAGHRDGLMMSLAIMALMSGISLPYVAAHPLSADGNFTLQLYFVSAILVASLYFFSGYQRRLQLAQLTVDELGQMADTDQLTGLPNRRRTAAVIESELVRFARYGRPFSVILIDVDHFKAVNDTLGHVAGDKVLIRVVERALETLRDVDTLGRWGGEEFVLILPETDARDSLPRAERLCTHVAAHPVIGERFVTVSCGAACVVAGDDAVSLLQRADAALYAAKDAGRNCARAAHDRADGGMIHI